MTPIRKRIGLSVAAIASLGALVLTGAPAASAAPAPHTTAADFRLYQNANYGGGARSFTGSLTEFSGQRWNNNQSMQNSASSMQNFSSRYVGLWDIGTSCTGASYTAKPNSVDASFSNNGFNDKASCLRFL